jgi:large subunit ribosomal protein L4
MAESAKASVLGKTAKADLPKELFSEPFHQSLVHEAARADLASRRRGTASTLTRGEVAFTTAKAWRQKGTGRARVGALGVSSRYGGGVTFGPKPRHYTVKVNRKARRRAMRSALSVHAERDSVAVLDATTFDTPSTKNAAAALAKWGAKVPIVLTPRRPAREAFATSPGHGAEVGAIGVADVIGAAAGAPSEKALETRGARLMDARTILIRPVISEKSYALIAEGKYTFRVDDRAHKTQIAQAVHEVFGVEVAQVRTAKVRSKPKRRGLTKGRTRSWKKAIVQLAPGERIELFEGGQTA